METYYNKNQNQYIIAAFRCGTNFLKSEPVTALGWHQHQDVIRNLQINKDTVLIKVIRDPYERWRSWFNNFIVYNEDFYDKWTTDFTINWLENYRSYFLTDNHCLHQNLLYNRHEIIHTQTKYVRMEELNLFLGISPLKHNPSKHISFNSLPLESKRILKYNIENIYRDDYEWMKTINFLSF